MTKKHKKELKTEFDEISKFITDSIYKMEEQLVQKGFIKKEEAEKKIQALQEVGKQRIDEILDEYLEGMNKTPKKKNL
jgi:DNA-binding PadR family transcriptional regulator